MYSKSQWSLPEGQAVCNDCDRKRYGVCNKNKCLKDFDPATWELADGSSEFCCRECTRGRRSAGMWTCANRRCRMQKPRDAFSRAVWIHGNKVGGNWRQCDECLLRRENEVLEKTRSSAQQVQKRKLAASLNKKLSGQKRPESMEFHRKSMELHWQSMKFDEPCPTSKSKETEMPILNPSPAFQRIALSKKFIPSWGPSNSQKLLF